MLDVFRAPQVGIASIEKELGEAKLRAMMVKWMNAFLNFYSTNGTMGGVQVADTINLIIEEYPHYTQDDFKLFFNMAKKGMFEKIYGRVDGDVILRWLKEYDIHRDTRAQEESIRGAERHKTSVEVKTEGVSYEEYLKIKKRADQGDTEAIALLKQPQNK